MLELDEIPLNGRSLEEYSAIFGLEPHRLKGKLILDAAAGPSTFAMQAVEWGIQALAADPAYSRTPEELAKVSLAQIAGIRKKLEPVADLYNWDYYRNPDDLRARRERVTTGFLRDFSGPGRGLRYVAAALPRLPFASSTFDMALCSHFLFLFADRLDYSFHLSALVELARVCRGEALVYPVTGMDGVEYRRMPELMDDLAERGVEAELRATDFEFLKGARRLMRLSRMG